MRAPWRASASFAYVPSGQQHRKRGPEDVRVVRGRRWKLLADRRVHRALGLGVECRVAAERSRRVARDGAILADVRDEPRLQLLEHVARDLIDGWKEAPFEPD